MTIDYPTTKSSPRKSPVRLVVLHSAECPRGCRYAHAVGSYLASPGVRASIHAAVADDCAVTSVTEDRAAWHAGHGPTNDCSLGLEQAGYASWSREEWLADGTVHTAARVVSEWMARHRIAPVRLQGAALRACVLNGQGSGWCTHHDVTQAFGIAGGHTDPGDGYPYDVFQAGLDGINRPAEIPAPPIQSEEDDDMKVRFYRGQNSPTVMLANASLTGIVKMRSPRHVHDTVTLLTETGAELDTDGTTPVAVLDEDNGKVVTVPIRIVGDAQAADMLAAAR